MRRILGLTILTVLAACGRDEPPPAVPVEETRFEGLEIERGSIPEGVLIQARTSADELTQELGRILMSVMQEEGPVAALAVCADTAQVLTSSHASSGIYIRRVSARLRNPLNQPDAAEARELDRLAELRATERLPAEIVRLVREGDRQTLHYIRPITVAAPCVTCHGAAEQIPTEVMAILRERYPSDAATGYAVGDLRGAVSVRIDVPE
jgi:hypothetical protein